MKIRSTIFFCIKCAFTVNILLVACKSDLFDSTTLNAPRTTRDNRRLFDNKLRQETILSVISQNPDFTNEKAWQSAFWAMELCGFENETAKNALTSAFEHFESRSPEFKRAALECAITLFPDAFLVQVQSIMQKTESIKLFAMAVYYLCNTRENNFDTTACINLAFEKFPHDQENPILIALTAFLEKDTSPHPSLLAFLRHIFPGQATVLFSFQRANRDYPGLTLIRERDGKFLRNKDGSLFCIAQLARSLSKMPGFLTNGNSPQGIYSVGKIGFSDNVFIGPAPVLNCYLPYEAEPKKFLHSREPESTKWNIELYSSLLPESWRNFYPIYESFYAGQAGRSEIIVHGSTINPDYYEAQPFYPLTPSLGCLTAYEEWSSVDGQCLASDQVALVNGFLKSAPGNAFLVVLDLDNKDKPVTLKELEPQILLAEQDN